MATCPSCKSSLFLGGIKEGGVTFCSEKCRQEGYLMAAAGMVPEEIVQHHARELHGASCPLCQGPGPVDVHQSHRIHSMVVVTQWQSLNHVCCRACARKKQLGDTAYCFFLGWWGFPWGLAITPVQIGRNLCALLRAPAAAAPSRELHDGRADPATDSEQPGAAAAVKPPKRPPGW